MHIKKLIQNRIKIINFAIIIIIFCIISRNFKNKNCILNIENKTDYFKSKVKYFIFY